MKSVLIFVLISVIFGKTFAQRQFPNEKLNNISAQTYINVLFNEIQNVNISDQFYVSGNSILRQQNKIDKFKNIQFYGKSADTLFIGLTPGDSLHITGNYNFNGTILVVNDGKLVFEDCEAVINGDIIIFGDDAKVWMLNSTMHFPQSFIYQRGIIAAGSAELNVVNSTLDYYGLSHDLSIADNAVVNWTDVTKIGFTTCGLSSNARINIDGTNQAGEFNMMDNATANLSNATTILIWHHIPSPGNHDVVFPNGTSISNNEFSDINPGVSGIEYSYTIENCNDVMWGLMPEPESELTITDSKIRTVGVWFRNQPEYGVSGLVNNSHYSDFIAPLSNHNIHFINSDVQTWSLYMFHGADGNVSNCILGEIGTMGNSECTMQNCLIDGSGGYLFATDTSVLMSAFSYLNCNFQTSGNAFGIMAYGGQNMGKCIAFEKSIMILVQANLVQQPIYYDDAMMWYLYLDGPEQGNTESEVPISGSAWIEKASNYYPTEFGWYVIDCQIVGSDEWFPVCDTVYNEVFSDELCVWNTAGINPGYYNIRITMCDNTLDQNKIEAVRQVVLTNMMVYENDLEIGDFTIYPNPVLNGQEIFVLSNEHKIGFMEVYDLAGKKILDYCFEESSVNTCIKVNLPSSGIYFVKLSNRKCEYIKTRKIFVQ
jgi:hypothetical protein